MNRIILEKLELLKSKLVFDEYQFESLHSPCAWTGNDIIVIDCILRQCSRNDKFRIERVLRDCNEVWKIVNK